MKKILKLILIIAMLCMVTLTMTGCGEEKETSDKVTESKVEKEDETTEENEEGVSRGKWNGDQYVNEFANIKFNLPSGWEIYSDEEIEEMMGANSQILNPGKEEVVEITKGKTLYAMVVDEPTTGASISIMIENPIVKITEEGYLQALKQQLEAVSDVEYEVGEITTAKLGGEDYSVLRAKGTVYGVTIDQEYYVRAKGDYIIGIIITPTVDGQLDTILKSFK